MVNIALFEKNRNDAAQQLEHIIRQLIRTDICLWLPVDFYTQWNDKVDFPKALEAILSQHFTLERRMLMHINQPVCQKKPWALNDICIQRTNSTGMITIDVKVNDTHLNTYWGDGLIISTPTGSTAYSLSCGGPILTPSAEAFILTPIASHSLSVCPLVLPAESIIEVSVHSRENQYTLNVDSHTYTLDSNEKLQICKERFAVQTIRMQEQNFYKTLRDKLLWGIDIRN